VASPAQLLDELRPDEAGPADDNDLHPLSFHLPDRLAAGGGRFSSPPRIAVRGATRVSQHATLEERPLGQWDYFHCPADTCHVIVGAGDGPCPILMLGSRPEVETLRYSASKVAAKYGASAAKETDEPDEAYANWPGEYLPVRLPWPPDTDMKRS